MTTNSNFPLPSSSTTNSSALTNSTPLSITKSFRPYYGPIELTQLVRLQASSSSSSSSGQTKTSGDHHNNRKEVSEVRVEVFRQLACGFIERVAGILGFPRRTTATAQTLYHRFHLHHHLRDFSYQDVSISALLVASKLEDTLKKLREIQNAAWKVNNLLEGGPGTGEGDTIAQESARPQLIAIERLMLESLCFNFNSNRPPVTAEELLGGTELVYFGVEDETSGGGAGGAGAGGGGKDVFGWVVRFGRSMGASKNYTFLAHLIAIDVHRTLVTLSYPPHTIALACLYLTSFLIPNHFNSLEWKKEEGGEEREGEDDGEGEEGEKRRRNGSLKPNFLDGWCSDYESIEEDVEEITHSILNLFIQLCPLPSNNNPTSLSSTSTKPSPTYSPSSVSSPSDPNPNPPRSNSNPNINSSSNNNSMNSERNNSLLLSGIPHTLSGQWITTSSSTSTTTVGAGGGGEGIIAKSIEDFTRIKIVLRQVEKARIQRKEMKKSLSPVKKGGRGGGIGKSKGGKGMKRDLEEEQEEEAEETEEVERRKKGRVERWKGGEEGWNEVRSKLEGGGEGEGGERKAISVRYQF